MECMFLPSMDTHDLLRSNVRAFHPRAHTQTQPLKYLWRPGWLFRSGCTDFCMHWLGRVDPAYTFPSVVCVCVCLDAHAPFYRQSRIYSGRANKYMHSNSAIVEKKAYNTKSRQFLDNFPPITTFFMHISKHFDDSLNTRLHIYHFASSSLYLTLFYLCVFFSIGALP